MDDLHEQARHIHTLTTRLLDEFAELREETKEIKKNLKRPADNGEDENENGQANGVKRLRTASLGG